MHATHAAQPCRRLYRLKGNKTTSADDTAVVRAGVAARDCVFALGARRTDKVWAAGTLCVAGCGGSNSHLLCDQIANANGTAHTVSCDCWHGELKLGSRVAVTQRCAGAIRRGRWRDALKLDVGIAARERATHAVLDCGRWLGLVRVGAGGGCAA